MSQSPYDDKKFNIILEGSCDAAHVVIKLCHLLKWLFRAVELRQSKKLSTIDSLIEEISYLLKAIVI